MRLTPRSNLEGTSTVPAKRRAFLRMLLATPLVVWLAPRLSNEQIHIRNGWVLRADDQ
jgi:hypothetical protein